MLPNRMASVILACRFALPYLAMPPLYPDLEPFKTHLLKRDGHSIYFEECGHPDGLPALFLHGGPGGGCKPHHRRFFNPALYRIVLVDQRGAGRSTPQGELRHNTTAQLLEDLEAIRKRLEIESWLLFAGSWGVTLALLYAAAQPQRVAGMILRGSFLARPSDLDWFISPQGVRQIYPDAWDRLLHCLPEPDRAEPLAALYRQLTGTDELAQRRAARAWEQWGGQVALGEAFDLAMADEPVSRAAVNQARIELHYAVNHYFIRDNAILESCDRFAQVPTWIVHGRRDLVCPTEAAYRLHRHLPHSTLRILPGAGHLAAGEDMVAALVEATDSMAVTLGVSA